MMGCSWWHFDRNEGRVRRTARPISFEDVSPEAFDDEAVVLVGGHLPNEG